MRNRVVTNLLYALILVATAGPAARCDLITLGTSKDASIFSESNNNNGLGNLYVGVAGNVVGVRRALLQFDISGSIPAGSTINSVTLTITQTRHGPNAIAESMEIHPLLALWGEGTGTNSGTGDAATAGAVTWNSRQFGSNAWATAGGSFGPASGSAVIGLSTFVPSTFTSQPTMVADVQNWLTNPAANNGWILKFADETTGFGAREIGSKESGVVAWRPQLSIDFSPVPEPNSFALLGATGLVMSGGRLRRRKFAVRSPNI